MNVLIIGSGGREHALAWKCAQSAEVDTVFVAPGNAGTARETKVRNVAVSADNTDALVAFAREKNVDLTIVGPETPLVEGLVDRFAANELPCFGPSASAARLEGSKVFCKDFLARHRIPTADYRRFTEIQPALEYVRQRGAPIVVKADGLAAGKGVIVAMTLADAERAVTGMLVDGDFGNAGGRVVIEEYLDGEEASFIVITDGEHVMPLATSQDHKARDEGDVGPNTGGMGAYSPAPVVTPDISRRIMDEVIRPTLQGMRDDGNQYLGFLYAGLMIMADGTPKVIEFNCRLGDPETQAILMRLQSDLPRLCLATIGGTLSTETVDWDPRAALGVVLAAAGYPADYEKGKIIEGLDSVDSATQKVFHAGTASNGEAVITSGGRVLCVVGLGESVADAADLAYDAASKIHWDGVFSRRDIGYRAIAREQG